MELLFNADNFKKRLKTEFLDENQRARRPLEETDWLGSVPGRLAIGEG